MRTIVLAEFPMIDYVLLARVNDKDEVYEFVCAYHYDKSDKTWGSRSLLPDFSNSLLLYSSGT